MASAWNPIRGIAIEAATGVIGIARYRGGEQPVMAEGLWRGPASEAIP